MVLLSYKSVLSQVKKISKSVFFRNVATVATGTAGAQGIAMAFAPIITRLYGPEQLGLFGIFIALTSVFNPIAALTYPIAIVLPKTDIEAKSIAHLSISLAVIISCLIALGILITGNWITSILNFENVKSFILFIPLAMLFAAIVQVTEQWLIRRKQFRITARVAVLQALLINATKACFGLFYPIAAVLILVTTFGQALHASMLAIGMKLNKSEQIQNDAAQTHKTALKVLVKRYSDFPLFRASTAIVDAASQNLPTLLLAAFFGPASAGFYALCKKVLGVPANLIGKSVGDVFYPRIAEAVHKQEKIQRLIIKATGALALVGFAPFAMMIAFGPNIFIFVFGAEWYLAGEYSRWLSLFMFFSFINRPSVVAIPVLGLQGFFLIYELTVTLLRVSSLFVGFYFYHNALLAVALFSIMNVLMYVVLISYVIGRSSRSIRIKNAGR